MLKFKGLSDKKSTDEWVLLDSTKSIIKSPIEMSIKANWNDQGWGNTKGHLRVVLVRNG